MIVHGSGRKESQQLSAATNGVHDEGRFVCAEISNNFFNGCASRLHGWALLGFEVREAAFIKIT